MTSTQNWRSEYRFRSHWFELTANLRMHYVDEGTSDQPVLAVHGNPTWSFYWRKLVEKYSLDRRVIAVDHLGCGLSDKPQNYNYCLTQHRDNLLALIFNLELQNITLVVHDWGGPIGLSALIAEPQRFKNIILLNTGAFPPPFIPWRIAACRFPLLGTLAMRGGNVFSRAAIHMAMSRRSLSSAARQGLLFPYDSWKNRIAVDRFVRDIPTSKHNATWQQLGKLESELGKLTHLPVLMIWGMKDWCFRPECLYRLQKIFPNAKSVEIADAGHYVMEDATDQVLSEISSFLQHT